MLETMPREGVKRAPPRLRPKRCRSRGLQNHDQQKNWSGRFGGNLAAKRRERRKTEVGKPNRTSNETEQRGRTKSNAKQDRGDTKIAEKNIFFKMSDVPFCNTKIAARQSRNRIGLDFSAFGDEDEEIRRGEDRNYLERPGPRTSRVNSSSSFRLRSDTAQQVVLSWVQARR